MARASRPIRPAVGPAPLMTPNRRPNPRYSFLKSVLKRHNEIESRENP